MGLVAALVPRHDRLQRLQVALRGRHTVEAPGDWAALAHLCDTAPVSMVIIDLFLSGSMLLEPLRQLRRRHPRLITVLYITIAGDRAHDVFNAGRAGVDGLVIADRDDGPERFAALLEQAEARGVAAQLRSALAHHPPLVRDATLMVVTRAHEHLTTDSVARAVALSKRALARKLLEARLPPPKRLITWGRLIVAAQMLEDPQRSADSVAVALGFPSGSAFRNACQRYLQATPTQLREQGGVRWVIGRLVSTESSSL
jgi:AraC-like DNA-binding protein